MTNDSGRNGGGLSGRLRRFSLKGVSVWRLLELAAVAAFLVWIFGGTGRPDRSAIGNTVSGRPVVATTPANGPQAAGSAFSDTRALVPGTKGPSQQSPPNKAQTAAAQPAPAAALPARPSEPPAKSPVAEPSTPTQPPARPSVLAANIPPPPTAAPIPAKADAACPAPEVHVTPLAGGQTRIRIASPCRRGQDIGLVYDGVEIRRQLPASGTAAFALDLFAGDRRSVDVTFADGSRRVVPVVAADLDKVSKIAVRWRAPVNLDLHVFEHAAGAGQPGHVWAGAATSADAALKTQAASGLGRGFLTAYDDGQGERIEVYTYIHGDKDQGGTVAMALDHETRGSAPTGATCGQGALARVEFAVTMLSPRGEIARAAGRFKPASCDQPLAAVDRFDYALMPTIAVRN